jgi:hypothetical protein
MVLSLPKAILEVSLKKIEETIAGKESNSLRQFTFQQIVRNDHPHELSKIFDGESVCKMYFGIAERSIFICHADATLFFFLTQSIFLERCDLRL